MFNETKNILANEIERKSFEIIEKELGDIKLDPIQAPIIKRVIHTTADFSYIDNLCFSENVVENAIALIRKGASIITDTKMVAAGINAKVLNSFGGQIYCFMDNEQVIKQSQERQVTRSSICMEMGAKLDKPCIFAIGNAPTALIRLYELIKEGIVKPELIIGVPVGFVNVIESKELIIKTNIPYIVSRGRKGGSNVAACICNAILYLSKI